jgi:hypothetical protein
LNQYPGNIFKKVEDAGHVVVTKNFEPGKITYVGAKSKLILQPDEIAMTNQMIAKMRKNKAPCFTVTSGFRAPYMPRLPDR